MLAMVRPDPKLGRAFGVLPLSAGDTAAAGPPGRLVPGLGRPRDDSTDEYWTQQSHTASVPDVTAPVYMITGWYDIFLPWQLRNYAQLAAAGRPPRLTIGPWGHVSAGMGAPGGRRDRRVPQGAFAGAPSERPAPVRAYLTGAEQWHDLPSLAAAGLAAQAWYLHAAGRLDRAAADGGVTTYTYDPDDPTPAVGGPSLLPELRPGRQRRARAPRRRGRLPRRAADRRRP